MGVTITRKDRGLDFRRIEKIIEMFQKKCNDEICSLERQFDKVLKEREKEAFEHFGLNKEVEAIKAIDEEIRALEKKKRAHEKKIREYTQSENNSYGDYMYIRSGSIMYDYIHEGDNDYEDKKSTLKQLREEISEKLWLAKDIDEAVTIYEGYMQQLNNVVKG
jgi:dynactin complex subunit